MSDVDRAISEWRRQMRAAGIEKPLLLDELESHLRDEVEQQLRSGATAEAAFDLALQRLGPAPELKAEFDRAGGKTDVRSRKLLRISVLALPLFVGLVAFGSWFIQQRRGKIELTFAEGALALAALGIMVVLAPLGRYLARFLPAIPDPRILGAAIFAALVVGTSVLRTLWGLFSFGDLVQLQVAILWTMTPWLAVGAFFAEWGVKCEAARKRMTAGGL